MQNINQRIEGSKLIIEIDLSQEQGPSTRGKSITIANSGFGTINHPEFKDCGFKLNVWKRLPK